MKKYMLLLLVTLLLVTGCDKKVSCNPKKIENVGNVCNVNKAKVEIPKVNFLILGLKSTTVNEEQLKDIQVYNFDAVTKNDGEVVKHNYTGIKLKDFLDKKKITLNKEFSTLTFSSVNYTKVVYDKKDINDNMWLIFQIDNKDIKIREEQKYLTLMDTLVDKDSWAFGIQKLIID